MGISNNPTNSVSTQPTNSSSCALVRYLPNGTLDPTFNPDGTVPGILQIILPPQTTTPSLFGVNGGLNSVVLTPDDKIIAAGTYNLGLNTDVTVLKFNQDGSFDTSFNATGQLGKTPGVSYINVGQFTIPNNVVNGTTQDTAYGVALDSLGRIVVVGSTNNGQSISTLVIRLTPNGELDPTFNANSAKPGIFVYSVVQNNITSNIAATAVAINPDDSIIVGGTLNGSYNNSSTVSSNFYILKLTSQGVVDKTFNAGGNVPGIVQQTFQNVFNQAFALQLDMFGNIVIAGSSQQFFGGSASSVGGALTLFAIARYLPTGLLDTTFNANGLSMGLPGTVLTSISQNMDIVNGLAIAADGALVVTGVSNDGTNMSFATARYTPTGVLDPAFNPTGSIPGVVITQVNQVPQYTPTPTVINTGKAVVIGSNSEIYVSGFSFDGFQTNFTILNYLSAGVLNTPVFNPTGLISNVPGVVVTPIGQSLTIQGNGVPMFITEDVSGVSPDILSTLRQPFELIEPIITTDTRPVFKQKQITLKGTASPNAFVALYVNGFEVAKASARYTGEWYAILPPLLDGTYEVVAVAQDPLSGISLSSLPVSLKVRTYVPKPPHITKPFLNQVLTEKTIVVEGMADPGALVTLFLDEKRRAQVRATGDGRWHTSVTNIDKGSHVLTAQARIEGDTRSKQSEPVSFSVDLSGEKAPVIISPKNGFVSTSSQVRLEGQGSPNSTIKLYANTKLLKEVPVNKEGKWSALLANLEGAHEFYATTSNKNYASQKVSGKLILPAPREHDFADPMDPFSGYASPGGTIKVYSGTNYLGMTKANKDGRWTFTPLKSIGVGYEPIKIDIYDAQGIKQSTIEKSSS